MGLRDEITAEVAAAFDGDLADAVYGFTGSRQVPIGEPDPVSQTQPSQLFTYEGRGVFGSYSHQVVDGLQILRTDIKLKALQAELVASGGDVVAVPEIDDQIQKIDRDTGQPLEPKHKVIHVVQDPAGATWSIQIRRA